MSYRQNPSDPVPEDPVEARIWKVYYVVFEIALKEKMNALGIEATRGGVGMEALRSASNPAQTQAAFRRRSFRAMARQVETPPRSHNH